MSFSKEVKEELSRQMPMARHCQIAEIAAIISFCGNVCISSGDRYSIKIHTEKLSVARKCFTLVKKTFNIYTEISIRQNAYLKKSKTYTIFIKGHEDALRILQATKLLDENHEVEENLSIVNNVVIMQSCCKRAFIRGAFLAAGSISTPQKFYHFEIVCQSSRRPRRS